MGTKRKIFLLLAGLPGLVFILLFVLYFSAAKLINSESIKEKIHLFFFEKAGAHITFESSEFRLFPLPEIIFHQVRFSIPDKAEGSVPSLRIHPSLLSLMIGRTAIAKVGIEAPHLTIRSSEKMETPSLKEIEEKARSVIHYLVSKTPGIKIVIRDGKLDVTKEDEIAFSFDLIQSQLNISTRAVDIKLTSRSDMWDNFSVSSSIKADDLKSEGTTRLTHLRPGALLAHLSKDTAGPIGISDIDLSMSFETSGLRIIHASMESSVSELALSRGENRVTLGEAVIKGKIEIEPDTISVRIDKAKISRPSLNLSGQYNLNRNSDMMTADLEVESIPVKPVRESALDVGGDIPLIKNIFAYVQGGEIRSFRLHTSGKSPGELGQTKNIKIAGKMRAGSIYIESKDLTVRDIAGSVVISEGILTADHIEGSLGDHRCSRGKLRVGLMGTDAPFHLDAQVKADLGQLPSFLKNKRLIENEAVINEMSRIHNLRGRAEGRLILGERLDSIHVKILVDNMNLVASYEPLPFPLAVTQGKFSFDEKAIELSDSAGGIGGSSFSGLTARLMLTDTHDLEIAGGVLSISADEIYPWITSFEKIRPVLNDVRSLDGTVSISAINLQGPLYQPNEWKFNAHGKATNLTVDAAFLPGKAEKMNGTFQITQNELSLKNIHTKIIDSPVTVTGSVREFRSDIRDISLAIEGEIGREVNVWIASLLKLPTEMKISAPFSIKDAVLSIEKERKTAFSGRLLFEQRMQVSLDVTKTPDSITIRDLTIKDRSHNLVARIALTKETIDAAFSGTLTSQTLNTIFTDSIFSNASLEGSFKTHVIPEHPHQSTAEGRLKAANIPVPLDGDIPLVVRNIALEAKGQSVVIDSAELEAGGVTFKAKGIVSSQPDWMAVDMDISAGSIEWKTFGKMLQNKRHASHGKQTGTLENLPVRGTLRLRSDAFQYRQLRWEPLDADVSFDGKKALISVKKSALCGVSTTGAVSITEQGLRLDITLSAKDLAFEPAIVCLTDKHADLTGTFEMAARLKGEGKIGEIADRLEGDFTLSAKDGKILRSDQLNKTFGLLNQSDNFKGQFPDIESARIRYSGLKTHGLIQGQKIQIEEAILDASSLGIIARGYIDLGNETLDLNIFVSPLKTIYSVIPVVGRVVGSTLVSIPVKISGDIKDPQITFLSPSAMASETLGIVPRLLKLPVTFVEPIFPAKQQQ